MRAFILRRLELIAHGIGDVVLIGSMHSAGTLRIKEFLTRNGHPFAYIDLDRDADVRSCWTVFTSRVADVPVADLPRRRRAPQSDERSRSPSASASTRAIDQTHVRDLVVVGAGPGGTRRGGLRRVGRARRAGARVERARRPGRVELENRELSRLPDRHLRAGAGRPRLRPGAEVRRRR